MSIFSINSEYVPHEVMNDVNSPVMLQDDIGTSINVLDIIDDLIFTPDVILILSIWRR